MAECRYIVDSMSPEEILDLYRQEIPFVNHKLEEFSKIFSRRLYDTHRELTELDFIQIKRKSNLNLSFIYLDRGTSYIKNKRLIVLLYFWFYYRGGISAIRPILDKNLGIIPFFYTSHFLQRYLERGPLDKNLSKTEALRLFLMRNPKRITQKQASERYPNNCYMLCEDGICFSEVKPNSFIIMKTFLSWEQLSATQNDISVPMLKDAASKGMKLSIYDSLITYEDINNIEFQ